MSLEIVPQVARKQNGKFRQPPLKKTQVASAIDFLLQRLTLYRLAVVLAVAQRGNRREMAALLQKMGHSELMWTIRRRGHNAPTPRAAGWMGKPRSCSNDTSLWSKKSRRFICGFNTPRHRNHLSPEKHMNQSSGTQCPNVAALTLAARYLTRDGGTRFIRR